MIKCLILDWGGVCYPRSALEYAMDGISKKYKIPRKTVAEVWDAHNMHYLLGKESGRVFWRKYSKEIGVNINLTFIKSFFSEGGVDDRMLELVRKLKDEKYKTVLLSDNYKERTDYIVKKYKLETLFNHLIFSNEVGMRKPQREIYEYVINKVKLKPQECIFVDDLPKNVDEANKVGINAFKFENYDKFVFAIKSLGVKIL